MAEVITLDSDEETEQPDLVVGPSGTAVSLSQAGHYGAPNAVAGNFRQGPSNNRTAKKLTKKPGVFPPFALFSQEHRDHLIRTNPNMSFAEVGRKLGEMWHALSEEEKEDYRSRARSVGEQKLKAWQAQVKRTNSMAGGNRGGGLPRVTPLIKKRKTHGYAIFSSEMRKSLADTVPFADTTRVIAEKWRNASPTLRHSYEQRASRINEVENKRVHLLMAQQQQQQQRSQPQMSGANRLPPPGQRANQINHVNSTGLRISSVSSLSSPQQSPKRFSAAASRPAVSLPSSITISRVEPEVSIVAEQSQMIQQQAVVPRGGMNQRMARPMPSLKRGGMSSTLRGRTTSNIRQQIMQQQQQHMMGNGNSRMGGVPPQVRAAGGQMPPHIMAQSGQMKRLMRGGSMMGGNNKFARMAAGNRSRPTMMLQPPRRVPLAPSKMCRACSYQSPYYFKISDKPELMELLKICAGLHIDAARDVEEGYPDVICRKCVTILTSLKQFRKTTEVGQEKLKAVIDALKPKLLPPPTLPLPADLMPCPPSESTESILPDLDLGVDYGENPANIPQPVSIKQEKISVTTENRVIVCAKTEPAESVLSNGKEDSSSDTKKVETENKQEEEEEVLIPQPDKSSSQDIAAEPEPEGELQTTEDGDSNAGSSKKEDPLNLMIDTVESNFERFEDMDQQKGDSQGSAEENPKSVSEATSDHEEEATTESPPLVSDSEMTSKDAEDKNGPSEETPFVDSMAMEEEEEDLQLQTDEESQTGNKNGSSEETPFVDSMTMDEEETDQLESGDQPQSDKNGEEFVVESMTVEESQEDHHIDEQPQTDTVDCIVDSTEKEEPVLDKDNSAEEMLVDDTCVVNEADQATCEQ